MKNNQQNHIGMFMYLTQIKAVLFAIISAISYYRFLGSTPFEITHGIYSQQINYARHEITGVPQIDLACLATCS